MNTITNPALTNALHAFETVHFPVVPDDQREVLVAEGYSYGSEGFLSADLYKPEVYLIDESEMSLSYERLVHENVNAHRKAVLKANLGYHGGRAILDILGEALIVASDRQKAVVAVAAGNTLVKEVTGKPSETWLALWDDGTQYEDADELEDGFMRDRFRTLARPIGTRVAPEVVAYNQKVFPTEIVAMTAAVFNGQATFVSKDNRMDVTRLGDTRKPVLYEVMHSKTQPIVGNLVVARMPHTTDRYAV
jgi:hypothetical protein